jgi:hypothetical protein
MIRFILALLIIFFSLPAFAETMAKMTPAPVAKRPPPVWVDKPASAAPLSIKEFNGEKVFAGYREYSYKECPPTEHHFDQHQRCKQYKVREPLQVEWLFSVPRSSINTSGYSMQQSASVIPPPAPPPADNPPPPRKPRHTD